MSGRHHHYLPQFIQRPFAYRRKGEQSYVHAHHRTRGRYTPNTKGLGQELDFYGGPEDTALDDAITKGEDALAATLRAINEGCQVDPLEAATLICALGFRAKAMRDALIAMFPTLMAALRIRFGNRTRLQQELMASLSDPRESKRLIYEEIDKRMGRLPREERARRAAVLQRAWKPFVDQQGEQIVSEIVDAAYAFLAYAHKQANEIGTAAYLGALSKDPYMPVRARRLASELSFSVLEATPEHQYILGDCGPVAVLTDGRPSLMLGALSEGIRIHAVYLPVSPTHCLVGQPSNNEPLRVADINRMSAGLALEFFISSRGTGADLDELRSIIGTLTAIDSHEDIVHSLIKHDDCG